MAEVRALDKTLATVNIFKKSHKQLKFIKNYDFNCLYGPRCNFLKLKKYASIVNIFVQGLCKGENPAEVLAFTVHTVHIENP